MKFAIIDGDGEVKDERYETLEDVLVAANRDVTDTPETEVEIVQVIKKVSSTQD